MNIDEARGRALDALVARHVFGLTVEPTVITRTREPDAMCQDPSGEWVPVPYYSSVVSGSLRVQEKLQDLGWRLMAERRANLRGAPADLRVMFAHSDGRIVSAIGGSFNQALCRAALKAVIAA